MTDADSPGVGILPAWLLNAAALSWRLLAIVLLAFVGWLVVSTLWTVTAAIAVAVIVSAAFAPLVLRLRDRGRSRNAAAGIVWAIAVAIVCGVPFLLFLALLPELDSVAAALAAGLDELQSQMASNGLPAALDESARNAVGSIVDSNAAAIGDIVSAAAGVLTVVVLAVFLLFFFLRDGDRAWGWFFQATGEEKRELIGRAGDVALARIGGYVRGMTVLGAIVGLTNWLFLWLLGVPLAVPLAILSFVASYVPYIGGIVATVLILLVSLAAVGTGPTIVLFLLMAVRSVLLSTFVRPAIYSHTMRINPALILVAIAVGAELGGIIGLLAAVPLMAAGLAVAHAAILIVQPESPQPLPALVPSWIDRLAQVSWRVLVALGLAGLLVAIAISVPLAVTAIVLGMLLAAAVAPLVATLQARGSERGRASALAVGGVTAAIGGLILLSIGWLAANVGDVGATATSGAEVANDAAAGTLELAVSAVQDGSRHVVETITGILESVAAAATTLVLGVLLAFFLLRDGPDLWRRVVARVIPEARHQVGDAGGRAVEVLSGYIIGTAAVSFVGAASQFLIMVILGLPLAVPVFVLSFFLGFIPYVGSFLSTGIAFLITLSAGSPTDVVIMLGWTVVFNIVQGNIVSPVVYGRTVHLHPAIVLVAIPAAATIAGILGMFLVVPILGVIAATWRLILSGLSGREPVPGDDSSESSAVAAASPPFVA
jgi:predicted PurR-regulated permease PerM